MFSLIRRQFQAMRSLCTYSARNFILPPSPPPPLPSTPPASPPPVHRHCTQKRPPVDLRNTETTTYKSCRCTRHSTGFTEPSSSLKNQDTPSPSNNTTATTAASKTAASTWDPTLYDTPFHTDNFVLRTDRSAGSVSSCSPPPPRPAAAAAAGATHEQPKSFSSLRPAYFNDFDGNLGGGGAGDEWIAGAMKQDSAESSCPPYARAGAGARGADAALRFAMQGLRVSNKEEGEQGQQFGSTHSPPRVEDDRLVKMRSYSLRFLRSVRCRVVLEPTTLVSLAVFCVLVPAVLVFLHGVLVHLEPSLATYTGPQNQSCQCCM